MFNKELPDLTFELSLRQELSLREIELELEKVPQQYGKLIYSLVKQNMILRNNITNLVKGYTNANPNH